MFSFLKGRWTLWIIAMIFAGLAAGGSLLVLGNSTETKSYWVLEEDVAAGVQITQDMLFEKVSPVSAAPGQAITAEELANTTWYSKIPLVRGTVMQPSVLTDKVDFIDQAPEGFVIVSILVEPQNAAAGKIIRGDYIDIAAISGNDVSTSLAKVILERVLVLDVTVSPSDIAESANSRGEEVNSLDSSALYAGTPSMYLLAVSSTDFAKLAIIRDANLYLALSAKQTASVDTSIRGGDLFLPGAIEPSSGGSNPATDTVGLSAAETKQAVEAFYLEYQTQFGATFSISEGNLIALDANGLILGQISLNNGVFNIDNGEWTE
jgi:Flp pilus assembly protein CpaB